MDIIECIEKYVYIVEDIISMIDKLNSFIEIDKEEDIQEIKELLEGQKYYVVIRRMYRSRKEIIECNNNKDIYPKYINIMSIGSSSKKNDNKHIAIYVLPIGSYKEYINKDDSYIYKYKGIRRYKV